MAVKLPSFGIPSKKILAGAFGLILVVAFLLFILGSMDQGSVAARFSKGSVKAGETTKLALELRNTLGEDMKYLRVMVTPVDPNTITVPDNVLEQYQANFGKGERRVLQFDVYTAENAIEGSYSLVVETILDKDAVNVESPDYLSKSAFGKERR